MITKIISINLYTYINNKLLMRVIRITNYIWNGYEAYHYGIIL